MKNSTLVIDLFKTILKYKKFTISFLIILFLIYPLTFNLYQSKVQNYNFSFEFDNFIKYQDKLVSINFDVMLYSAQTGVETAISRLKKKNSTIKINCNTFRYKIECTTSFRKLNKSKEDNYTAILIRDALSEFYESFLNEYIEKISIDVNLLNLKAANLKTTMEENLEFLDQYNKKIESDYYMNSVLLIQKDYYSNLSEINNKIYNYETLKKKIDNNLELFLQKNTLAQNHSKSSYNVMSNLGVIVVGLAMYLFGILILLS